MYVLNLFEKFNFFMDVVYIVPVGMAVATQAAPEFLKELNLFICLYRISIFASNG